MASPQKENGFTPIASELLEAFYRCKFVEYERVCIMYIWRKTYGWNKKNDWIANSQFSEETGIPRPHITRTLRKLLHKKVIQKAGKKVTVNKNYEEWEVEWRVTSPGNRVTSPGNKKLPHQVPTIERSINTKELEQSSDKLKANQEKDMGWKEQRYSDDFEEELQIEPDHKPNKPKKKQGVSDDIQAVFELFSNPAKVTWRLREIERVAAQALFDTYGLETLKRRIDRIEAEKKKNADDIYFPLVTTPSQLLDKMESVERYLNI